MVNRKVLALAILGTWSLGFKGALGQSMSENIRPVGQICVAGQACVGSQINASDEPIAEVANDASSETESDANE